MRGGGWGLSMLCAAAAIQASPAGPETVIVVPSTGGRVMTLAAREIQRYTHLRTGVLLPIGESPAADTHSITLGVHSGMAPEDFSLKTRIERNHRRLAILGGSELAVLYGAYAFAEKLGVRFQLHGDVIPDGRIPWVVPELDETHHPLFATRGIQPFHDFTEGPDWWTLDDYKAYLAQLAKMRMNLLGLHCYPEGGVGPEPLVWIGLPEDVRADGTVKFSYPSRWASTGGGAWGYASTPTSEFAAGASLLFPSDDYGAPVTEGFRPLPKKPEDCNQVFNRAGDFLREAFTFGHTMGIRICIGTETPLHIPELVRARLKELGADPEDPATIRRLYQGMFKRIQATHPLDFYWLWTPEDWTWGGNQPGQLEGTLADLDAALGALNDLGDPFTLATCGWVLGPQQDRAALHQHLPPTSPLSCINREVGFAFVEPAFARIQGRPQWAIPWLEDDPNMVGVQLWVGRIRRDAADAHAYGCTGLLGIHWRTRVLGPNFSALAQAGWDNQPWNPEFGADRLTTDGGTQPDTRNRDLPCEDLYADWVRAEFGSEVARELASLFTRLDGGEGDYSAAKQLTRLPRPSDWLEGPGGIKPNATPWTVERLRYGFIDEMEAVRPAVRGDGNRARFDLWLNTFRYLRALGQIGCQRGALDALVKTIEEEPEAERRKTMTLEQALPLRLALARQWEMLMTDLLQTVTTPGDLGTIANLEQHSRRNPRYPRFLDLHDAKLAEWAGAPLPPEVEPSRRYRGPPRVIVPTVRTVVGESEPLALTVLVLANERPKSTTLHWRSLGVTAFREIPVQPVARAVHQVVVPASGKETKEYYLRVQTSDDEVLYWPPTAPTQPQTVVTLPDPA